MRASRRIIKTCRELPGYELFQYVDDDGARQVIDSADVNAYLREISGEDFTAKDFRTWTGTVLAAKALADVAAFTSNTDAKRKIATRRSNPSPSVSATRRRCAGSATSIRRLSTRIMDGATIDT